MRQRKRPALVDLQEPCSGGHLQLDHSGVIEEVDVPREVLAVVSREGVLDDEGYAGRTEGEAQLDKEGEKYIVIIELPLRSQRQPRHAPRELC